MAHYRAALQHRPGYAEAHFNMAVTLRGQGSLEAALEGYESALKYRTKYPDALRGRALVLAQLGRFDDAIAGRQGYLTQRPDDIEAVKSLADLLLALDRAADAAAAYAAALEKCPGDADLLNNMGVALVQEGRFAEASEAFAAALERKPDFADAQYNAAVALKRAGRTEEAIAAFEATLQLRPDSPDAHQGLGTLYALLGRDADAARVYRHWQAMAPDHPVAQHMAAIAAQVQIPPRASNAYIRDVFATFAPNFDQVLADLNYRVPDLIAALIERYPVPGRDRLDVLDAGCGTGLCGALLRPIAGRLVGIDLSPEMLGKARDRGLYDALVETELASFMGQNSDAFDLIVSADTLVYFGDLAIPLAAAAGCLRPGGRIAFNLERAAAPEPLGYRLNRYGRYMHTEAHVRDRLGAAGFTVLAMETAAIREQALEPVQGLVVLAAK
ncbi:MAG TPA: tetratricopeptide repeat protein [Stellaceae bacterium]